MLRFISLTCLLLAAACDGTDSGATCPASSPPTYDSFGRTFMQTYCTGCHSRDATDRHGAPPELDFDTEGEIRAHAAAIDSEAASGPNANNTDMPDLTGPVLQPPSLHERELLGQFLACERR